ncbi:MAG TPA: DnaA/Hda family protein, partial [Acidimicrobiales bacterium]|nr:DnaA/Hda family protein [Acidimicrobiales bacterium]
MEYLVNDMNDLWKRCESALREQVSDATWRTWLAGLTPQSFDGALLVLGAPSTLVRDRVESRFFGLLTAAVSELAGQEAKVRIEVVTTTPIEVEDTLFPAPVLDTEPAPVPTTTRETKTTKRDSGPKEEVGPDSRYTFDAFVIGSSNRFAHAAALSVAEMPALSYNPLFIHGGAGLGKTHLLHAIG